MVARFFRIRSSEMSLAALRVNMVSLQRLPMLRMRHWMDVDGARFSLRKGCTHVQCLLSLQPSLTRLCVPICPRLPRELESRPSPSHAVSLHDLGGGVSTFSSFAYTADRLCKLEVHPFPRLWRLDL